MNFYLNCKHPVYYRLIRTLSKKDFLKESITFQGNLMNAKLLKKEISPPGLSEIWIFSCAS